VRAVAGHAWELFEDALADGVVVEADVAPISVTPVDSHNQRLGVFPNRGVRRIGSLPRGTPTLWSGERVKIENDTAGDCRDHGARHWLAPQGSGQSGVNGRFGRL
jgi:hypothetical protein